MTPQARSPAWSGGRWRAVWRHAPWWSSLGVTAGLLALWWTVSAAGWVSRVFLPSPQATALSLWQGMHAGDLGPATLSTVRRMLLGWGVSSLIGVVLGVGIGLSRGLRAWVVPSLEFIRPLPAAAVMPLAISVWGLSDTMVLAVVAFGSMWPVLLATAQGMASVHPRLHEVAAALQLRPAAFVWKIGLPHAMPDILAALRLALTVALIVTVVGEILGSQPGLGQVTLQAARAFRSDELFAGVALLGAVGFGSNVLLALAERRLLRWQR